jgi:hypothetical protein
MKSLEKLDPDELQLNDHSALNYSWVDPGLLDGLRLLTALPAFVFGRLVVGLLGALGINQVTSFMAVMPALIGVWYYFIGWLLDRRAYRRKRRSMPTRA